MFFQPIEAFYRFDKIRERPVSLVGFLRLYLKPHHWGLFVFFIVFLIGSLIILIFPFLTQALINRGIGSKNLFLVWVLLSAQLFFFLSNSIIEFLRNWIMLNIGT
ncbi:MAG: hypothetical protein ACMUEM_05095 [Flavobacteriales bacterium AspAUS03]